MIVLAIGLGLINAVLLLGWGPIDPTNIAWVFGDNATYYTGWSVYRHDTHLHFPLAWTERLGYPIGTSIALLDATPLVAILLRPLSPLLPDPFQYLGVYFALCFVLQASFGLSLCRRLFPSHTAFVVLGSLFFLVSAPLTWRALGHVALTSHWLIVAALDGYLRDPAERAVAWLGRLWIVLALAAAISPYIAGMCLLVTLAGVARLWLEARCRWRWALVLTATSVVVMLGTQVVVGVLVDRDASTYMSAGYGLYSLNLNAPVNPMAYPSVLLPTLATINPAQIEGYNYLGLGVIALFVLGLARRPTSPLWLADRRWLPLVGLALVCAALAVSTSVSLNSSVLFQIPMPTPITNVLYSFRASGRLFWPAYYLIVTAVLSLTFWTWKDPYRIAILVVALAVQVADLRSLRSAVLTMARNNAAVVSPLKSPAWQELGQRYENLIVLPAYQCAPFTGPGGYYGFVWFGKLVAAQRMRTNSYYAARYTRRDRVAHCVDLLRTQLEGTLDPRSAYVVTDGVRTAWEVAGVRSHKCQQVDGYNLCTTVASGDAKSPVPPIPVAAAYAVGDEIEFAQTGNAQQYKTVGWGDPLPDGTWTDGPIALVRLGLIPPPEPGRALVLEVNARAFVLPQHPRVSVDVVVNGQFIDHWLFRGSAPIGRRKARIPASVATSRPELDVELRVENPEAPMYLGPLAGPLPYFLGLNVRTMRVRYD